MEPTDRVRTWVYRDDGYPESQEYDSNYFEIEASGRWRWLLLRLLRGGRSAERFAGAAERGPLDECLPSSE